MKNFIQDGDVITVTAPAVVAAGAGVLVGSIFGVAVSGGGSGAAIEVATEGVFVLAKATGAAWTEGARIYWDDTAKNCTITASSNKLIGVATRQLSGVLPASGDTTGTVLLTRAYTL